ncbi:MAG: aspartate kinase [Phycisphaerales bacterium]|nr:aspartate kinase [Phycisphaerales bacterium]
MAIVVQKFGGSSCADAEKIRRCAERVLASRERGDGVAVVVSAMGKTTDRLIQLANECWNAWRDAPGGGEGGEVAKGGAAPDPGLPRRELDQLLATGEQQTIALMAMVLEAAGQRAVSYTGAQAGMVTDRNFSRARIAAIDGEELLADIRAGRVPVVAGFQGVTDEGDVTTLGRGGSDTTAVALAAALQQAGAGRVVAEIFTDVDGVYTADPRVVPRARKLDAISYEEMLEMATEGARVMHNRAVEFGARYKVPILVLHSQREAPGTWIVEEAPKMEGIAVAGLALKTKLGRVTLTKIPDAPGVAARIFAGLAEAGVVVDDIIQTVVGDGVATVAFTVEHSDLAAIKPVLEAILHNLGGGHATIDVGFSKVSAVGVGVRSHAGVAAAMFKALAEAGVNIANITTSEIKIGVLIDQADGEKAMQAVHRAFGLDRAV